MISNDPLDLIKLDDQSMKEGLSIYSMFSPSSIPTSGRMGLRYNSRANKSAAELVYYRQSTFRFFLYASRLRIAYPPSSAVETNEKGIPIPGNPNVEM
jgi:hypothetical protein